MWVNVKGRQPFDYLQDLHGLGHPGVEEPHVSVDTANTRVPERQRLQSRARSPRNGAACELSASGQRGQETRPRRLRQRGRVPTAVPCTWYSHTTPRAAQTALRRLRTEPLLLYRSQLISKCLCCRVILNTPGCTSHPNSFSFSQQEIVLENSNQMGSAGPIRSAQCLDRGAQALTAQRARWSRRNEAANAQATVSPVND